MEKFVEIYQPVITIRVEDDLFGTERFSIVADEQTRTLINDHQSVEIVEKNKYALGLVVQQTAEHKALEDSLEPDGRLKERILNHSIVTYDYAEANDEYTREVISPAAATVSEDLDDHIFENSLLLRFFIKVNPLLKDSLLPEDTNEPKLVFADDILTPSSEIREKTVSITPVEDGGLKWEIDEEGKALNEITALNLDDDVLAELQVNIPAHLTNVHSISYHIHIKRKTINNP